MYPATIIPPALVEPAIPAERTFTVSQIRNAVLTHNAGCIGGKRAFLRDELDIDLYDKVDGYYRVTATFYVSLDTENFIDNVDTDELTDEDGDLNGVEYLLSEAIRNTNIIDRVPGADIDFEGDGVEVTVEFVA